LRLDVRHFSVVYGRLERKVAPPEDAHPLEKMFVDLVAGAAAVSIRTERAAPADKIPVN
jgi:hypothetical protein